MIVLLLSSACAPGGETPAIVDEPVPARAPLPPLPTTPPDDDDLASSPRADARAEVAALRVERDRWVASDAVYARTVADFAAIEAALPTLSLTVGPAVHEVTGVVGNLVAADDDEARAAVAAIGAELGGSTELSAIFFEAQWPARLQPRFSAAHFAAVPGVREVFSGRATTVDGPRIESEQFDVDGKTVWLVLEHHGDCPVGCDDLIATRVRVEKADDELVVDVLDSWSDEERADLDAGCPAWLRDHWDECASIDER